MKAKKVILTFMVLWLSMQVFGASNMPSITKQYKNVPLSEVLRGLEKKTKYTIIYNPEEVDGQRLITSNFKDARLTYVIKRLMGKSFDVKVKGKIITISLIPPQEDPASTPSKAADKESSNPVVAPTEPTPEIVSMVGEDTVYRSYTAQEVTRYDTIWKITKRKEQRPTLLQPTPLYANCSHHIFAGMGMGYGEVYRHGHVAATGDFNYAFFFKENWGVSAGIGIDYYHTSHAYEETYNKEYVDTDGEIKVDLHVQNKNMRHDLRQVNINLPIMLHMEYQMGLYRAGDNLIKPKVYAAVGARLGMPVFHRDNLKGEQVTSGYYEKWDLHLEGLHEYSTSPIEEQSEYEVKSFALAPQAEVGFAFPVNDKTDIAVGAYANVSVLNVKEYLPWQVGAKLSVRWNTPAKTKPRPVVYEDYFVYDSTFTLKEIKEKIRTVHYDTIPAAKQIAAMMEKSIIWFDLNDITPKLEPADMLDRLAAILVKNPTQRIQVNGHTCDLGQKAYNEKLSMQRAQAVADLLIKKGVNPAQIKTQGFANSKPYYSAVHDRVLDRRVEILPIK